VSRTACTRKETTPWTLHAHLLHSDLHWLDVTERDPHKLCVTALKSAAEGAAALAQLLHTGL